MEIIESLIAILLEYLGSLDTKKMLRGYSGFYKAEEAFNKSHESADALQSKG
jgi:hypothetical protein